MQGAPAQHELHARAGELVHRPCTGCAWQGSRHGRSEQHTPARTAAEGVGAPAPAARRVGPSAVLGPGALPRLGMGRMVGLAAAEACAGATAWPSGPGSPLGPEMGAVAVPTRRMMGGCAADRAGAGSAAWAGRPCWLAVGLGALLSHLGQTGSSAGDSTSAGAATCRHQLPGCRAHMCRHTCAVPPKGILDIRAEVGQGAGAAAGIPKTAGVGLWGADVPGVSTSEGAGARGLWDEMAAEDGTGAGALAFCEVFWACKAAPGLGAALRELLVPSGAAAGGAAPARGGVQQSEGCVGSC